MAHNMIEELEMLCEKLTDTMSEINSKLKSSSGRTLPAADLDYVDKMTHALKSIKTIIAMEEAYNDDYSERYDDRRSMRYDDRSSTRGRRNARRDSMGRYSRDYMHNYSRDDAKDEMIDDLREMMKMTDDDRARQEFQAFISKMENMR